MTGSGWIRTVVKSVAANRRDGMGIALLHKAGIPVVVLSTEPNPVVAARCHKLNLPVIQGLSDKSAALRQLTAGTPA